MIQLTCTGRQADRSSETINKRFAVNGVVVEPDSLNAYLAAHRGFTSRGGEMRCAYKPLDQRATRVFVWAVCSELVAVGDHLVNGSGMSLPAAFEIEVPNGRPRITRVDIPEDGDGYAASIRRIFPASTWPAIFSNGTRDQPAVGLERHLRVEAATRFGLSPAAASASRQADHPPPHTQASTLDSAARRMVEFLRG